jgi:hypothetical protein
MGCWLECPCGNCGCGCDPPQFCDRRKKRYADDRMYFTYSTGNSNMNVEMCILGCATNSFIYAGLKYGYALIKPVK